MINNIDLFFLYLYKMISLAEKCKTHIQEHSIKYYNLRPAMTLIQRIIKENTRTIKPIL